MNPTAVVACDGPPLNEGTADSCDSYQDTYFGNTRAAVTNSGSNTVSILDLVNDDVVNTVVVGNNPDAIVVSSDGSTACVANYGDGTVSSVTLASGTVEGTVPVGGNPTSIALSSTGTLWVGGTNFLTEMNASTMASVMTVSTGGKAIVALGYSDESDEITATTLANNNVYVDEVSPAGITSDHSYAPVASAQVSQLETHFDSRTDAYISSFTAALASSPSVSPDLPGSGPLVVDDSWAVISATPTGFSVSDLGSHKVLFSVATPSPVTAIAVDPTLNTAYLALPDSGVIYSVPLPGTVTTTSSGPSAILASSDGP